MTDCNHDPLSFSRIGPKAVVADFRGGRLTTDSGALLLREVERSLGLFHALDVAIPDPRQPELIEHDQKALLAQRITAIACGYEDLNDHLRLRRDPALQLAAGRPPEPDATLASPATLCRLENRIDRATLARIAGVLVDQFIASHDRPPASLILDFDATDDPIHGRQEGRFFHGYYDRYCYLPLYVFCGDELPHPGPVARGDRAGDTPRRDDLRGRGCSGPPGRRRRCEGGRHSGCPSSAGRPGRTPRPL